MGRMYSAVFSGVTISAIQDLFHFAPVANKPVVLHSFFLSQDSLVKDAAEEMWRIQVIRGYTGASTGTSVTPGVINPIDTAAGCVVKRNMATGVTGGTPVIIHAETFNVRTGFPFVWTPETRPKVSATQTSIVIRLMETPTSATNCAGTVYFEEL